MGALRKQRDCEELIDVAGRIGKLEEWLKWYRGSLQVLIQDYQLLVPDESGERWSIRLAVDFHEVFRYVFPFRELTVHYGTEAQSEKSRRELALNHLMRAFILHTPYDSDSVTILPPHMRELSYAIQAFVSSAPDEYQVSDYFRPLENYLPELRSLFASRGEIGEERAMHDERRFRAIFDFMREKHDSLLFFVASLRVNAKDLLSELVEKRLKAPEKGSMFYAARDRDNVEYWRKKFHRIHRNRFPVPTRRDAEALDMIERVNRSSVKQKTLYLFVSSARRIVQVVQASGRKRNVELPNGERTSFFRTLDQFRVCLRHCPTAEGLPRKKRELEAFAARTLENMIQELNRVKDFLAVTKETRTALSSCPEAVGTAEGEANVLPSSLGHFCSTCRLRKIKPKLEQSLSKIKQTRLEIEDSDFLLRSTPYLAEYAEKITAYASDFEKFILEILVDKSFEEKATAFIRELRQHMTVRLIGLSAQVAAFRKQLRNDQLEVLTRFPFGVELGRSSLNQVLSKVSELVRDAASAKDMHRIQEELEKLMGVMLEEKRLGPDKQLVEALVLFAVGQAKLSRRLCSISKELVGKRKKRHFTYLEALSALLIGDQSWSEAYELSTAAISEYPNDIRFALLASHIRVRQFEASGCENEEFLLEALSIATAGLERKQSWGYLKAALANNKAYSLGLTPSRLSEAFEALGDINVHYEKDEKKWPARWLHTKGFLYMQEAQLCKNKYQKLETLGAAEHYLRLARDRCLSSRLLKLLRESLSELRRLSSANS